MHSINGIKRGCLSYKAASFTYWGLASISLPMLEGCMHYIVLQEIDHTQYGSFPPVTSLENNPSLRQSRLAWCFGDLGIAWALWQTGSVIKSRPWQDKAIAIMEYATRRVNREQTLLNDCSLCHGSAGITMVFRRFYLETQEKIFNDAWRRWIDFTLNFKRFDDGPAGFKTFELRGWKNDRTLLTGISGIELALLSFIRDDLQEWDELLLLSLAHNENYRWIIAFKMIDALLSDFLFTVEQKLNLMERQSITFKTEFGFDEFNAKQFNTKYRNCMKSINNVIKENADVDKPLKQMTDDIHKRSADLKPVFLRIIKKSRKNGIDYLTLPAHYIHMMLNRLFYEKARMHELIVYEFLRRYYASEIARSKSTSNK